MKLSDFPNAVRMELERGEFLFHEGDSLDYVYFCDAGKLGGNLININGGEFFANIVECGKGIGSVAALGMLLSNKKIYTFSMSAFTRVVCYRISSSEMLNYLRQNPDEMFKFTEKLMLLYEDLCKRLNSRQQVKTIEQYCKFILEHGIWVGSKFVLGKQYSNIEVARVLNVHPVTLSRMQTALQNENMIEKQKNGMLIKDVDKLQECADGLYIVNYRKREKE